MRHAIFVDVGYVYAQGSAAVAGSALPRRSVELDLAATKEKLLETAAAKAPGRELLRIYWYDGLSGNRLTVPQQDILAMENVKLRLGVVNEAGQQKGVDALIMADLMELARNHAIADACLLSGDEDLRVAVQVAQSYGVRVHLIGIEPSRGSQSRALMQEADTHVEWSKAEIRLLIAIRDYQSSPPIGGDAESRSASGSLRSVEGLPAAISAHEGQTELPSTGGGSLEASVRGYVNEIPLSHLEDIARLSEHSLIPAEYDRPLLAHCGRELKRALTDEERNSMRVLLREMARQAVGGS